MKSYNEFVNEKFDYTKQHNPFDNVTIFSDLSIDDSVYILVINDLKPEIHKGTIKGIKSDFADVMLYLITDIKQNSFNIKKDIMGGEINIPMVVGVYEKSAGMGVKHYERYIISTQENLLKDFVKSKQYKKYISLYKGLNDTRNAVKDLIYDFLR